MCLPTGGGKAAKRAEREEQARQASIASTTGRINSLFDSPERQAQQQDYLKALRSRLVGDVTRQRDVAARNQKFALAKAGLTGGSAAVDAGRQLGEETTRGLLEAERRAQSGFADLVAADEGSRADLIGLAQNGLSTGDAASRAAQAMRTNASRSSATAGGTWDVFSGVADLYKRQQESAAKRAAQVAPVGSVWGTN